MKMKTNYLAKKSEKGSKFEKKLGCLCNAEQQTRQESGKNILVELFNDLQNMVAKKPKESMKVTCGYRCKCNCGCRYSCQEKELSEKKKGCFKSRFQDKLKDSCKDQPDPAYVFLSPSTRQNHIETSKCSSKTCQKKKRSSFEDQVKKHAVNDTCCPSVLKFIVEDLYKDIKAMKSTIDYGLYGRKDPARRGVSIWVDNCCKTRLHTTSYNSTCAYDVDVTKNHIIILYPLVTEDCMQEVVTSGVKTSICKRNLSTPKGPLLPISWTPSVYVYIPGRCKEDA